MRIYSKPKTKVKKVKTMAKTMSKTLSNAQVKRLETHSKNHTQSHMNSMKKLMMNGDSFSSNIMFEHNEHNKKSMKP
jgi:hypothetical protein